DPRPQQAPRTPDRRPSDKGSPANRERRAPPRGIDRSAHARRSHSRGEIDSCVLPSIRRSRCAGGLTWIWPPLHDPLSASKKLLIQVTIQSLTIIVFPLSIDIEAMYTRRLLQSKNITDRRFYFSRTGVGDMISASSTRGTGDVMKKLNRRA